MVWLRVQGRQSLSSIGRKAGAESDRVAPGAQLHVSRQRNMQWGYISKEKDLKFIELSVFYYWRNFMKVGIIGIGHVGGTMTELFPAAIQYDPYKQIGTKEEINSCFISFICVPTPQAEDGHCDTSIVEEVLQWVNTPIIVIRSTIPVGFTHIWSEKLQKEIVFQPEYYGETVNHRFADPHNRSWITLGGRVWACSKVAALYKEVFTSELIINIVEPEIAELAKYMENAFYATKVTFCNQFYELAEKMQINYDQLRETWLLDPRIIRDHTFVYEHNRGYSGSCLPKDMAAIIYQGNKCHANVEFLQSIKEANDYFVTRSEK